MQLIILTSQDDAHADVVIHELRSVKPDFEVIRINSENLSNNLSYRFGWEQSGILGQSSITCIDSGRTTTEPTVIWYRKPDKPLPHPQLELASAKECSEQEYQEFLRCFSGFYPAAKWVNDYWQMRRYASKPNQVCIAKDVGLLVPETVISNNPDDIARLLDKYGEIIVKPLTFSGFMHEGQPYGCFTNVLTRDTLATLSAEELSYAPSIFQQRIQKARELRITVVGEDVFACEITTRPGSLENLDWRIPEISSIEHSITTIPDFISDKLKNMLRIMGLNFGAFDVIEDSKGNYYYIELNPNGQYLWVELITGAKISRSIANLIVKLGSRCG